jgi:hypothetical protein
VVAPSGSANIHAVSKRKVSATMSIQFRSFVLASFSLAACGEDADKAQDKCEVLVTTYCDRVVSCTEQAGLLSAEFSAADLRSECETFLEGNARCEDAVRTSEDYGSCISESKANSCAGITGSLQTYEDVEGRYLSVLPESCVGAVEYLD